MPDSRAVRALLSLGMVVSLGATGTYAYWTDTVVVEGTTIKTGTIDLQVNDSDEITSYTTMNVNTMVPGDSTAGALKVTNKGTAPLHYRVDALATSPDTKGLASHLVVRVTGDSAPSGTGRAVVCPAATVLPDSASQFTSNLLGSAEKPRLLAPGQVEWVCIQATLPPSAPSTLQNATSNVKFTFTGTSF